MLTYPWDELLLLIAEGQEIEAEVGETGAAARMLEAILTQLST